jgi:hypothetical protein
MAWVWLDAPGSEVAWSLAWGVPRSLAVAWLMARQQGPPAEQR